MFGDRMQTYGLLSRAGQVMHDAFTFQLPCWGGSSIAQPVGQEDKDFQYRLTLSLSLVQEIIRSASIRKFKVFQ